MDETTAVQLAASMVFGWVDQRVEWLVGLLAEKTVVYWVETTVDWSEVESAEKTVVSMADPSVAMTAHDSVGQMGD